MPLWGWLVVGVAAAILVLWVSRDRRRRHGPVDPALVRPDPAEQRQAQARRRIRRVERDVPDIW